MYSWEGVIMKDFNEEDQCPICHIGVFIYPKVENCSCHINPPCRQCVNNELECSHCGITPDEIMMEE
jgi:hypothetical protein